tara:strand:- start:13013 stop:14479 length:1467 start_codon:yes stop_codon:yes gene_type:complete
MKKVITVFFLIFFINIGYSQNKKPFKNYEDKLNTSLKYYDNKAIQNTLLKENIAQAFSFVIFSNSELATNTSAFGYSQNKEKTTISINTNFRVGNTFSPYYIRAGANATGSKGAFAFYDENSWQNNAGVNLGLIRRIGKPSLFYSGKKEKKLIDKRREIYAREIIYNQVKYDSITLKVIAKLKKEILSIDSKKDLLKVKNYSTVLDILPKVKKLISEKKYEDAFVILDTEEKKIAKFLKAVVSDKTLKKYIENDVLYNFDKKNDFTYGYNLMWLDFNINLSNSTYKFNEDNIDSGIVQDFNSVFNLSDDINKLKTVLSLSFNKTHHSKNLIWYCQLGLSGSFGSFLSNSLFNGTPNIIKNQNDVFVITDETNQVFGNYKDINKTLATGAFNIYGAIFFTENKNFGFNVSAQHEYLINKPNNTYYNNNFTLLFGPIFRKVKDGATSLTFGIDLGFENGIYDNNVTNDFTGRIRVGIPFNIYQKKKKETE